jgi:hypothetical protein
MLLPRSAPVFAAAALGLAFSATFSAGMTSDIPQNCAVTLPSESISDPIPANRMGIASDGKVWAYGTKKLWTLLPVDGVWRGLKPRQPGDFAYSNKLPWGGYFRDDDGPLTVTGKRLDGPAPAFVNTEEIGGFPDGDEHAAIMGGIDIPLFGCWQITGHYTDQDLTFTVWVMPLPEEEASLLPVAQEQPSVWNMPPRRIHVDGAEEAKSLVYRVIPEIPHEAQVANISGTVVLHGVIGTDGRAHELKYVSGPQLLAQAAIEAVTWWEYRISGAPPVEIETTIEVAFPPLD